VLRRNFLIVRYEVEGFLMVNSSLILILRQVICYAARKPVSPGGSYDLFCSSDCFDSFTHDLFF